jgi:hypothetical protein
LYAANSEGGGDFYALTVNATVVTLSQDYPSVFWNPGRIHFDPDNGLVYSYDGFHVINPSTALPASTLVETNTWRIHNRFPLQRSRLDTGRISWFTRGRLHRVAPDKEAGMSRILLGIICGLVFGAIDIGIMLSMSFPDKRAAITAAFIARFGIGFVIGAARLPWPGWAVGLFFGVLLSIPDAIITKAYAPIIGMGALGGLIIGVIIGRFGQ